MKTANRSIKNLCKVRWWLTFPLGGLAMCDLEREVVGNHRPVAAIGPVIRLADFLGAAGPTCAGGELSAYCKDSVSRPAN